MTNLANIVAAARRPDQTAIVFHSRGDETVELTYREVLGKRDAAAAAAIGAGLGRNDRVALLAENSVDYLLAGLGLNTAGVSVVPMNTRLAADALDHIVADSAPACVFADDGNAQRIDVDADVRPLSALFDSRPSASEPAIAVPVQPDDEALVMYTSGSTGLPKGVPLTHAGYLWTLRQFQFLEGAIDDKTVLVAAPLFHMNAQFHVFVTWLLNGTVVLMERFDAEQYLDLIQRYRVARISGVPTMFTLLTRAARAAGPPALESVESVAMGSSPVSSGLLSDLAVLFPRAAISNGYGTTEVGPAVFGVHPDGMPTPPLSIGFPMPGVDVLLDGDTGATEGELWVKNPMRSAGYLNLPRLNEERFAHGWYRTGDVMRVDEDGFYFFVGRVDDMFVCGGENVYPGEIENRLESHPQIRAAAVVPIPDAVKGQIPVAFVVADGDLSIDAVKQYCIDNGPAYAHPRFVGFLSALPLTGAKKIDKARLARRAQEQFQHLRT